MNRFQATLLASSLALLALNACTPATPYRYSGLIPAARPIPFDGTTADEGSVRVEGSFTHATVNENQTPQLHDTALWVPKATVDGTATIAITPEVEVGGRFTYTSYDWSQASANGTPPLPNHPTAYGVGPEVHASVPLDREGRVRLGVAANALRHRMPIAQWTRVQGSCAPGEQCYVDHSTTELHDTSYRLTDQSTEYHWAYSLGLYPSYEFGDHYGHIVGMLGLTSSFKNDGFTDTTSSKGAISDDGLLLVTGVGYGISFRPLHASVMFFHPLTSSDAAVRYLFGGFATLGFDLELWEGKHK